MEPQINFCPATDEQSLAMFCAGPQSVGEVSPSVVSDVSSPGYSSIVRNPAPAASPPSSPTAGYRVVTIDRNKR